MKSACSSSSSNEGKFAAFSAGYGLSSILATALAASWRKNGKSKLTPGCLPWPFGLFSEKLFPALNASSKAKADMEQLRLSRPKPHVKRFKDLLICIAAMPVILPLALLLALLIRLDSSGPAIYRQERIGKGGKPFTIYKFRTMTPDADEKLKKYLEENEDIANEWRKTQKLKNDPRLTRAGIFLRKTSLDELPQILNILKGDMTLVGPRPIVASETGKYGRYFEEYCQVRPGLTGLWQTSGRNDTTYSQRVAYDHYYINHWSLRLDLWILAKTIPVAISGRGAY